VKALKLERRDRTTGRSYLTPAGELPSVTTILDRTRPAKATERMRAAMASRGRAWARGRGDRTLRGAAGRLRTRAADRGTDVHERIEAALEDPWWDPARVGDVAGEDGWWHSAVPFLQRVAEPMLIEASVFSREHGFAGTLDLLARLDDDGLALVDWKTAASRKLREWIGDYELQAAAYRVGLAETYGVICRRAMIVVIYEDAPADVFEMDEAALEAAWVRFGVRLATHRRMR